MFGKTGCQIVNGFRYRVPESTKALYQVGADHRAHLITVAKNVDNPHALILAKACQRNQCHSRVGCGQPAIEVSEVCPSVSGIKPFPTTKPPFAQCPCPEPSALPLCR